MSDPTPPTATELARAIRAGERSPVDVVETHLQRIDAADDEINAFVTVCADEARATAREAERAVESGASLGPLHGVPVAVKDLNHVAGVRTTFGSVPFADNVADGDDTLVARLKDAGAVVVGKTNTPEFGRKPMTTNLLVGATGNPWDPSRTVGGSSGGSAAALAAGMVPIAQGSDAAGSIRIPAACCGVVGIMPDHGRVPLGPGPDAFVNTLPYTFAGPMARTVEDAALMLDVMAGPHRSDPFSLPRREGSYVAATTRGIDGARVAYSPDLGLDIPIAGAVREVADDAVSAFETAGATVERSDPAFEGSWEELHDAIEVLLQVRYRGLHDNLKRDFGVDLLDDDLEVTHEVISRIEKSMSIDGLDLRRAERVRTAAYDAVQELLREYDLLASPTIAIPPFEKDGQPTEVEGVEIDPLHGWILTWPFNLTGNPASSVPAGFAEGLPVGLQIVGPRLGDDAVVAASAAFERARPWADAYPP